MKMFHFSRSFQLFFPILYCIGLIFQSVSGLQEGDSVDVSMNKVWPLHNLYETYSYYDALPVCQPSKLEFRQMSFGQIMRGDRLVNSLYNVYFLKSVKNAVVCEKRYTAGDMAIFRKLIDDSYMFEIYVQNLPITKPIGLRITDQLGNYRYYLITNLHFNLGYNSGEVVSARVTSDENLTNIDSNEALNITFLYSVDWEPSETPVRSRLEQQLQGVLTPPTQGLDIHWLAITNSFVLVLLVTSILLLLILRVVRTDLAKYLRIPDEELVAGEDETGWKLLHADVFRSPPHRMWFCACVGSGAHLFLVTAVTVLIGCFSPYIERGAVISIALFGYLLTSFVAGHISGNLYRRLGGVQWGFNILVTLFMFMGPVFVIWSILNTVAIAYGSTAALPFSTASFLFLCWVFVTLPLTVLGAVLGRKYANEALEQKNPFPCKTNRLAREIPMVHWRHSPWIHVICSGFLPFSAIYIELHYVFLSVWGSRIYTLYGVLLTAFVMLLLVAGTVSVLLTYFHLNGENHKWWWRAFVSGGSVAFFFFLHCLYYFLTSTRMFGLLQCAFFFGYSLIVAWALFLIIGFVTFTCNYFFITYIYSSIKSD